MTFKKGRTVEHQHNSKLATDKYFFNIKKKQFFVQMLGNINKKLFFT